MKIASKLLLFTAIINSVLAQPPQQLPPNIPELEKSANQGDANAEAMLARCYLSGTGVDKNTEIGLIWALKAAQHGNSSAQGMVGISYLYGFASLSKNQEEAVKWLTLSANKGFAPAQRALSECYIKGNGVAKNEKIAVEYLSQAAIGGDDEAQLQLSEMYRAGQLIPEDRKKSFEWAERSAMQGNLTSLLKLASYYQYGYFVDIDDQKAFKYQLLAATKGSPIAAYLVGSSYEEGKRVEKDSNEAIRWFKEAAYQGVIEAQRKLACLYSQGLGVPRNYVESLAWCYIANSAGNGENPNNINEIENLAGREMVEKSQQRAADILNEINKVNPSYKQRTFNEILGIKNERSDENKILNSSKNEGDVKEAKKYYFSNLKEFSKDGRLLPFTDVKGQIIERLKNN